MQVLDDTVRGVEFRITGRVQGVAFRWFGCRVADELGVKGWIRNRRDGGVEGEAFGDPPLLERFLDRLRQGAPAARVDRGGGRTSDRKMVPAWLAEESSRCCHGQDAVPGSAPSTSWSPASALSGCPSLR